MASVAERVDVISKRDVTGGLKLLDCKHGFQGASIVILADGRWLLLGPFDTDCWNCHKKGGVVFGMYVECCPVCRTPRSSADALVRNYIIGRQPILDEHLLNLGLFGETG